MPNRIRHLFSFTKFLESRLSIWTGTSGKRFSKHIIYKLFIFLSVCCNNTPATIKINPIKVVM